MFENYKQALAKAGMTTVWTCSGDEACGPNFQNLAPELTAMHVSYAGLQAYDGYSTTAGIKGGATEANAIVRGLAGQVFEALTPRNWRHLVSGAAS